MWVCLRATRSALAAPRAGTRLAVHAAGPEGVRGRVAVAAARLAVPAVHHIDVRPGRWSARADQLLGLDDRAVRTDDGRSRLLRRVRQPRTSHKLLSQSNARIAPSVG